MDSCASNCTTTVQHVPKKSSDELLRKFADDDEEKEELRVSKRRKRSKTRPMSRSRSRELGPLARGEHLPCESPSHCGTLAERRSLLPAVTRKSVLLRQLGIGRSQLRAKEIKNKSILVAIEKTWRKTLEGTSKILLEKHYNRHKRLISDIV